MLKLYCLSAVHFGRSTRLVRMDPQKNPEGKSFSSTEHLLYAKSHLAKAGMSGQGLWELEEIEADRRIGRCISKRQGGRDWGLYRAAAGARGRHRDCPRVPAGLPAARRRRWMCARVHACCSADLVLAVNRPMVQVVGYGSVPAAAPRPLASKVRRTGFVRFAAVATLALGALAAVIVVGQTRPGNCLL